MPEKDSKGSSFSSRMPICVLFFFIVVIMVVIFRLANMLDQVNTKLTQIDGEIKELYKRNNLAHSVHKLQDTTPKKKEE